MTTFSGIDGESLGDSYFLVAIDDNYLYSGNKQVRLKTDAILSFILANSKGKTLVGYAFDFDVIHICRDLGDRLCDLLRGEVVFYKGYRLRYYRDKLFEIRKGRRRVVIYDVVGFFQRSFMAALKQWGIDVPEVIVWGKSTRVNFESAPIDRIIAYNRAECLLLSELMSKFAESVKMWGLRSWHGCGAIAHAMLQRTKAVTHVRWAGYYRLDVTEALKQSYYGGRIELCKVGTIRNVYQYDIRSAYPYALANLPHVPNRFVKVGHYEPNSLGCYFVRWNWLGLNRYTGPLPVRLKTGYIIYPLSGEGWYMSNEIADIADMVEVVEGWISPSDKDNYPYRVISDWYAMRQQWKSEGNPAEYGVKLGLNSIYGKFASQIGKFYQPFICSYITAETRAQIRRACDDRRVIAYATDSITTTEPLTDIVIGHNLGEWSSNVYRKGIFLMAGVYALDDEVSRTRGFKQLDIGDIVKRIDQGKSVYIDVSLFISPLNAGKHLKPFTFSTVRKELRVYSNFRRHYDFLRYDQPHKYRKLCNSYWDSIPWYDDQDLRG